MDKYMTRGLQQDLAEQLQGLDSRFLLALHYGDVDARSVARRLLAERGIGANGRWIGFAEAAEQLGP